jgi:sentrin-specific protease 7
MSRDDGRESSSAHFFSTHFFTTLASEGPEGVESWTRKKDVNIFSKKFLFIPINENLHWSLCVVVNPGEITRWKQLDESLDVPMCFMFFLDCLKAHNKETVRTTISKWLNYEWERQSKAKMGTSPFTKTSFLAFEPTGTFCKSIF